MSDKLEPTPSIDSNADEGHSHGASVVPSDASAFDVPALPAGSPGLQPKLDTIFAEVQAKLPSIDFEISDVSSDEELSIFSRSVRSPDLDDAKQDDQELSPETWQAALEPSNEILPQRNPGTEKPSGDAVINKNDHVSSAAELQNQDPSILQIGKNIPMSNPVPNFSGDLIPPSWNVLLSALGMQNVSQDPHQNLKDTNKFTEDVNKNLVPSNAVENSNNSNLELENPSKDEVSSLNLENEAMSFIEPILEVPTLDVERIEDIDLDLLIDAFPHPRMREGRRVRSPVPSSGGDGAESNISLMDKLTQLCINQSDGVVTKESLVQADAHQSKSNDSTTTSSTTKTGGRVTHKTVNIVWDGDEEKSTVDAAAGTSSNKSSTKSGTSTSTGSQTSPVQKRVRSGKATTQTIYLDLRQFAAVKNEEKKAIGEVSEAVKRILHVYPNRGSDDSSDSDSEGEGDLQTWLDQRRKARALAADTEAKQQDEGSDKQSSKTTNATKKERKKRVNSAPGQKTLAQTSTLTSSQHATNTATKSMGTTTNDIEELPQNPEDKTQAFQSSISTPNGTTKPVSSPIEITDAERERKLAATKKLREQREQEKASRLRLQNRLEAHRPKTSSTGKNPAAQATDVLFDFEVSYTSAPQTLPPFLPPDHECVLLTAHLSTSGELALNHKGGAGSRAVDQNSGLSGTYSVLLTWLLSLVPCDFNFILPSDGELWIGVKPFFVVGIQQVYQGSDLVLNIAIVPSNIHKFTGESTIKAAKKNKVNKELTPFQIYINKFLMHHTLHSVLAVGNDGQMMNEQTYRDGVLKPDGLYKQPLPCISNKPLSNFMTMNCDLKATRKVFDTSPGFYWETVDFDESLCNQIVNQSYDDSTDVQNTMTLVYDSVYTELESMNGVLHRVMREGLDLSGVRLLYATEDMSPLPASLSKPKLGAANSKEERMLQDLDRINETGPILALGLRGSLARTKWLDAIGPSDPQLARRTDPASLMALFGGSSREEATIYCPRQPSRVKHEMCLWFGGRVPDSGVVDIGVSQVQAEHNRRSSSPKTKKGKKGHQQQQQDDPVELFSSSRRPVSTLVATTSSDVFLTVAPIIPPMCVATVLATCQSRGFQLRGIKRVKLNHRKASSIGLSGPEIRIFSPVSCTTPTSPGNVQEEQLKEELEAGFANATHSPMPSLIVLLRHENAMHHSASLIESLMVTLSIQGMLSTIEKNCPSEILSSNLCFHITPYSDTVLGNLGGDFDRVPEGDYGPRSAGTFYSNPELEQVVVVTFSGAKAVKSVGGMLGKLLGLYPVTSQDQAPSSIAEGLELLGIKWLPSLTSAQAREITPYEVGDRNWQSSIQTLASNTALICVVRGINAFKNVKNQLGIDAQRDSFHNQVKFDLEVLVAPSAETAFRQANLFFRDAELYADPSMRVNLPYLPPLRNPSLEEMCTTRFAWADESSPKSGGKKKLKGKQGRGMLVVEESILKTMLTGPRPLNTILIIKPYAVRRHLAKILKRTIQENFAIVAIRLMVLTKDQAKMLLSKADQKNDFIQGMHTDHLTSGPVVVLCLQRENAVKKLLDVLGPDHPQEARKQSQFLWRALYGADPINNALHGSLSYSRAVAEQQMLFPDGVCCLETPDLKADQITCPAIDSVMGSHMASARMYSVKSSPVRMDSNESVSAVGSNHSLSENTQSSGVSTSSIDLLLSQHSALCQINCLVLTPPIQLFSVKGHKQGHVQVIDSLLAHNFEIVGMRMVWFQPYQAQEFVGMYSKQFLKLVNILCHGPSIVIAVQRDNAVSCFESAMGGLYDKDSIMNRYGEHILRAKDTKEATKYLEFFFDELAPRSQGEIAPKEE